MTEIRQPFGPNVGIQPGIGPPEPVPGDTPPSIAPQSQPQIDAGTPGGIGSPEWWAEQRIDPLKGAAIMGPQRRGTLGAMPSFEWAALQTDPRNLTMQDNRGSATIPQPGILDLPGRGENLRMFQFSLDMVDGQTSFDQIGATLSGGQNETLGQDLLAPLSARGIDFFSWDIPSVMADYGISVPLGWLGMLMGEENIPKDLLDFFTSEEEKDQWYKWQHQPEYWAWVTVASEEQMKQQAYQMSHQSWGGAMGTMIQEALMQQFKTDFNKYVEFSTSGDKRIDYLAKWHATNAWQGVDTFLPDASQHEREAWVDDIMDRMWERNPNLTEDKLSVRQWLMLGAKPSSISDPVEWAQAFEAGDLEGLRAGTVGWEEFKDEIGTDVRPYGMVDGMVKNAMSVFGRAFPFIGHDVASFIAPNGAFEEAFWMELTPEHRGEILASEGMNAMVGDMTLAVFGMMAMAPTIMSGAVAGAPASLQMAFRGYTYAYTIGKLSMAWNITAMSAHLALAAYDPHYAATTGAKIDAAAPISASYFAGVYNALGIVSTGTWGAFTASQAAGGIARTGGRWVTRVSGVTVPAHEFVPQLISRGFGVSSGRAARAADTIITESKLQENSQKAVMTSYLVHSDIDEVIQQLTQGLSGGKTGTRLDLLEASAKLRYVESVLKGYNYQKAAETAWNTLYMHAREPSTWMKLIDDRGTQAWKRAMKVRQSLDHKVGNRFVSDWTGVHGGNVADIATDAVKRVKRLQANFPDSVAKDIDVEAVVKAVGNDVEEMERFANRMHAAEFTLENGEMWAAAKGSRTAERIHLIKKSTLTQEDVTAELLAILRGADAKAQVALEKLRLEKDEVAKALAAKEWSPEQLAQHLEDLQPSLARRRTVVDAASENGMDPLNAYHRRLVEDGVWDIGFIPYLDEVIPIAKDWTIPIMPNGKINLRIREPKIGGQAHVVRLSTEKGSLGHTARTIVAKESPDSEIAEAVIRQIDDELPYPPEVVRDDFATGPDKVNDFDAEGFVEANRIRRVALDTREAAIGERLAAIDPNLVSYERVALIDAPPGFRDVQPGEAFGPGRDFKPSVGEKVFVNEVAGEVPNIVQAGTFQSKTTVGLPTWKQNVKQTDSSTAYNIQQGGYYDANGELIPHVYDGALSETLPSDAKLGGNPPYVEGFNAGARWPILTDPDGNLWVFKSGKFNENLAPAFQSTEAHSGALYALVGLDGAVSLPYAHNGVIGTVQPYFSDLRPIMDSTAVGTWKPNPKLLSTTEYDEAVGEIVAMWEDLGQAGREQAQGHMVMDWLMSQHDTNPGSLFVKTDGSLIGVDKGQSFKYFDMEYGVGDWPPRLDFKPNAMYGQDTFQDLLEVLRSRGVALNRGDVEDVLQKIESIPDDVFDAQMAKIGEARLLDNSTPGMENWTTTTDDFVAEMAHRRVTLRDEINKLYADELGSVGIPYPNATLKYFKTGKPLEYSPDFSDTPFRDTNIELTDLQSMAADARFTEPADGGITKAGVVIVEDDGAIWMAAPTKGINQAIDLDGYVSQTIKGNVDAGETLRDAAVREALEETGFGVQLDKHLIDYTDPVTGQTIRYYVGRRASGGPSAVQKSLTDPITGDAVSEVDQLILAQPDAQLGLVRMNDKWQRDTEIIQSYMVMKSGGTLPYQIDDAAAARLGQAGTEAPALPGVSPETARRYVSFKRLATGQYVRVPWVDQVMNAPSGVALGNRGYLAAKMDSVFQGFRTFRIAQTQRANLMRRITTDYGGITNDQISVFTRKLEEIAEINHIPVQFVGNANARLMSTAPLIGRGMKIATIEAAEAVFGKNMVNRQTGKVVPTAEVPWRDIIVKSYRQAFKHNLTAGFTSYIYSLPAGYIPAAIGQSIWPSLKFTFSPIFKVSEWAESFGFNAGRGIGNTDDMLELYAPHMGFSRSLIAGEQGLSPMINGMGFYRGSGKGTAATSGAAFTLPRQRSGVKEMRVWEDALPMLSVTDDVSTDAVATFLDSPVLSGPADNFPPTLADYTPEPLLPRTETPDGTIMVDPRVTAWDERSFSKVSAFPPHWQQALTTIEDMEQALYGLQVFRDFGYQRIDSLISSMPVVHSPGTKWLDELDFTNAEYQYGPRGTRDDAGLVRAESPSSGTAAGTIEWKGSRGSMGPEEMALGTGPQGKYAIMGQRAELANSNGNSTIIYNQRVIRRGLITEDDRISQGFGYADFGMSPQGLLKNTRYSLMKRISEMRPGQKLDDVLGADVFTNEIAIYRAPGWDDVDAIMFTDEAAAIEFKRKLSTAPQEVQEAVGHVELRVVDGASPHGREGWGKVLNDYMWEKAGLEDLRDISPIYGRDDGLISLLDNAVLPIAVGPRLFSNVRERAGVEGWNIDIPGSGAMSSRLALMDDLNIHIKKLDEEVIAAHKAATGESLSGEGAAAAHRTLIETQTRYDEAVLLWGQMDETFRSGKLKYTTLKSAQDAQGEIIQRAAVQEDATVLREFRSSVTAGDNTIDDFVNYIATGRFDHWAEADIAAFTLAIKDEQIIMELQELVGGLKFSGHGIPLGAPMRTWEVFGAKGKVTNAGGESLSVSVDPVPLGREQMSTSAPYVDAQAVLKTLEGRLPDQVSRGTTMFPSAMRDQIVPPEFINRLHEISIVKNGYEAGQPIVNVYVRGNRAAIESGADAAQTAEVVIVVKPADKEHVGLLIKEIEAVWMETGLPKLGVVDHPVSGSVAWDGINNRLLIGDMDAVPRQALGDGTATIDGTGIPGYKVVFEDVFESGGQPYRSLGGYGEGVVDPTNIKITTIGDAIEREYVTTGGRWDWNRVEADNTIDATSPIDATGNTSHISDARMRDVFDFAKNEGKDKTWQVRVTTADEGQLATLKRMWYLDEIPENVVLLDDMTATVLTKQYFQQKFGAPEAIKRLERPTKGLEEIPQTPENVQALFNQEIANGLGIEVADILAGDIDAIAAKLSPEMQETGLWEALKNIMDPIPYKERAMTRQAMHEVNQIFVGVLETTKHPALKLFREMGIPDREIVPFLLKDRDLLGKWLLHGRQLDLDRLMAHADSFLPGGPVARKSLDKLYASDEYVTMTQLWRQSLKAAQDEAFGTHFFNPYRNWLERSFNHPIFGIYPLSWSLKAAREWARFLFDNRLLHGFRLGMTPAIAVSEYTRILNTFAAQNGVDLGDAIGIYGPLGNWMMIASLLMPGDWSGISFPFSRTIREVSRGNMDVGRLYDIAMDGGIGRDIRLGYNGAEEMIGMLGKYAPDEIKGLWPEEESQLQSMYHTGVTTPKKYTKPGVAAPAP